MNETNFANCANLKSVSFTAPSVHMQDRSLSNCSKLVNVQLFDLTSNSGSSKHRFDDGAVETCVGPAARKFGFSTVPNEKQVITCNGCTDCTEKSGSLGMTGTWKYPDDTSNDIGHNAFGGCRALHAFDASGVTKIGTYAFAASNGLGVINIPDVEEIEDYAFYETRGLTRIGGGTKIASIGDNAFYDSFFHDVFPVSNELTHLGENAFYLAKLRQFDTGNTLTKISRHSFMQSAISIVILGEEMRHIDYGAFMYASRLVDVEIVSTKLTFIGPAAFSGCERLQTFNIPDVTNSVGFKIFSGSFAGTASLSNFYIPGIAGEDMSTVFPGSYCSDGMAEYGLEYSIEYFDCLPVVSGPGEKCVMKDGDNGVVLQDGDNSDIPCSTTYRLLTLEAKNVDLSKAPDRAVLSGEASYVEIRVGTKCREHYWPRRCEHTDFSWGGGPWSKEFVDEQAYF